MNVSKHFISACMFCLIYFSWVLFIHLCGSQYFTLFNVDNLIKNFNAIILLFLLCYFVLTYQVNKSTLIDIILVCVFIAGYLAFRKGVLIFLFIMMCRFIPFSLIVKTFVVATLTGMLFIAFTYALNLYPETYLNLYRDDGSYRYLLGYRFPTFMPNFYFHLILCWTFLRGSKINIFELIVINIINYFIYQFTDTKAVFALVILLSISIFFLKYLKVGFQSKFLGGIYAFFTKYAFLIFGLIAILLQYTYDPSFAWMGKLNTALSGRLSLGHWGFELYNITLFGNLVEFVPMLEASENNKFFYIDSAYVQLLLVHGVIIYTLFAYAFTKIGKEIVKRDDKYFAIVILFLLAHSMTDPQLLSPEFNPFLLCLGYYGLTQYRDHLFK